MAMAGTTSVDVTAPLLLPDQDLVYDWLTRHGVSWRVYFDGALPFFTLMPKLQGDIAEGLVVDLLGIETSFRRYRHFDRDFTYDPTLPSVIFIEPAYTGAPQWRVNDDHPPTSISAGQTFLYSIYRTLLRRPDRWSKTALIITYDEHGGFFDHVPPLGVKTVVPPDAAYIQPFETTGVRVPALIASPFVEKGTCYHGHLDHTSLLQLLAEKFAGDRRAYSEDVNRRIDQGIESVSSVLSPRPRQDVPPAPTPPRAVRHVLRPATPALFNENQRALLLAGQHLLTHDHARALREFPELAHLQS